MKLDYIFAIADKVPPAMKRSLIDEPFTPQPCAALDGGSVMAQVKKKDILLSYPYESMDPFISLLREAANDPSVFSIKITLLQILELLFASQSFIPGTQAGETSGDVNPLKAVFSYIESHYGEKISLEDLAGTIHMNRNYFCRFFKEKAGKTPFSYLNEYRVNQAASQLLSTRLPITEIALNAGFENMSYFIRQFRRCKGCTPSAYRNTEDPKSLPIPF